MKVFAEAAMTVLLAAAWSCGQQPSEALAGPVEAQCDLPEIYEKSPGDVLEGSGWHRLYLQGGAAPPDPLGRYALTEQRNAVALGDHFLLSAGALVEWTHPVVDSISGLVSFHIAHVDDPGFGAAYELFLEHAGELIEIARVEDSTPGELGYAPYEGCFYAEAAAVPPGADTQLLLRVTNRSDTTFGVVINSPDHFSWIDVRVQ